MAFPDFSPTLPELARRAATDHGDRLFVVLGEKRLSYRDAERESAALARALLARGVSKGARVAILMPNGPDFVVALLAIARVGAIAVPINTFFKARELGWVLRHADVHTLLCWDHLLTNDYLERLEACAPALSAQRSGSLAVPELPYLRQVVVWGKNERSFSESAESFVADGARSAFDDSFLARIEAEVSPADALVIIYSSGSTAEPKGAIHSHGAIVRHAYNLNQFRDLNRDDRIWSPMPFFWVGGLVFTLVSAMHIGCALICETHFEPRATLALMERERVTTGGGWPQYQQAMKQHPDFRTRDLSALRTGPLLDALQGIDRRPEMRSGSLGMTETGSAHTIERMDVDLPPHQRGSFGRSVPGLMHKIIDPETGTTLPTGATGEICVRGYAVIQGLVKREREEVFDADGYYHTGDSGHFDAEGLLYFEARLGEMIKTGGANVTPREVEIALDQLPGVQSSFVVGVPHPTRGQNVAAAVIPAEGGVFDPEALRAQLRDELAAYKVPRHIFFYRREDLPFTDTGKIERKKLAALIAARVAIQEGA
jgi:acyl-CoA synthetase (AMP-forming)/AMP-acid ligase II